MCRVFRDLEKGSAWLTCSASTGTLTERCGQGALQHRSPLLSWGIHHTSRNIQVTLAAPGGAAELPSRLLMAHCTPCEPKAPRLSPRGKGSEEKRAGQRWPAGALINQKCFPFTLRGKLKSRRLALQAHVGRMFRSQCMYGFVTHCFQMSFVSSSYCGEMDSI